MRDNSTIKVTASKQCDGTWVVRAGWKTMAWGLRHKDVAEMKKKVQRLIDSDPWFTYHY